jgi:hypothetical protein
MNELSKLANESISLPFLCCYNTYCSICSASAIRTFDNSLLQEPASRLHCLEPLHRDEREGLTGRQSVTNETGSCNSFQHQLDAAHWLV